jgi:hypothetical protein
MAAVQLTDSDIANIAFLTDSNAHGSALRDVASLLRSPALVKAVEAYTQLLRFYGERTHSLGVIYQDLYDRVKATMNESLSTADYDRLYAAL